MFERLSSMQVRFSGPQTEYDILGYCATKLRLACSMQIKLIFDIMLHVQVCSQVFALSLLHISCILVKPSHHAFHMLSLPVVRKQHSLIFFVHSRNSLCS